MEKSEIYKELRMPYDELCAYLITKYGGSKYDYFPTPECNSKNKKISRTSEGLYCHHIDEDKGGSLSSSFQARMQPFEWQYKERLVYCNILEHFILHLKIAVLRQKELFGKIYDIEKFFSTGGIFKISSNINDMFLGNCEKVSWMKRCFEEISENYDDYINIVILVLNYIDECYIGERNPAFLKRGSVVHFADGDCEILSISDSKEQILLKLPSGDRRSFSVRCALNQLQYDDRLDITTRRLAKSKSGFSEKIYNDIKNNSVIGVKNIHTSMLKVDYSGYGHARYADIKLSEKFGARNADIYISKALPMHCDISTDLTKRWPVFWKGANIPEKAKDLFYIVRVEAMFNIKKGKEPFVRYREHDPMRSFSTHKLDNNHNLKDFGWKVLPTSDIYDAKTNMYYSKYIDFTGKTVDAKVVLTMGKDDFLLFQDRYYIRYLKILDGCYFE